MDIDLTVLRMMEREREIPFEELVTIIEQAILTAYVKHTEREPDSGARVELDRKTGHVTIYVPEVDDDGEVVGESVDNPEDFGRIAAFAAKQRKTDGASMCLFGDGALEEGVFHESLNLAALWSLPVIYLCENNSLGALGQKAGEYSSSTIAARSLLDLATPYGIPAVSVDGTDAGAVHQAVQKALGRARKGQGPTFIEAKTFRWPGSRPIWPELLTGETDLKLAWDLKAIPKKYSDWHKKKDGLLRFTRELLKSRRATPEQILEADRAARTQIERAVRFAQESPEPKPEAALEDVFA